MSRSRGPKLDAQTRWSLFLLALGGLALLAQLAGGSAAFDRLEDAAAGLRHSVGVDPYDIGRAKTELPTLAVRARGPKAGYDRDNTRQWGTPWADVDKNGCGTRDDILRRDLAGAQPGDPDGDGPKKAPCAVTAGQLTDPYTGEVVNFNRRADPPGVQIDHVVSLSEAWRTGAAGWTTKRRREFANDPLVLLAVKGSVNISKSDTGADGWRPRTPYQCKFAARVVRIKAEYDLTVTPPERESLDRMLQTCQ